MLKATELGVPNRDALTERSGTAEGRRGCAYLARSGDRLPFGIEPVTVENINGSDTTEPRGLFKMLVSIYVYILLHIRVSRISVPRYKRGCDLRMHVLGYVAY